MYGAIESLGHLLAFSATIALPGHERNRDITVGFAPPSRRKRQPKSRFRANVVGPMSEPVPARRNTAKGLLRAAGRTLTATRAAQLGEHGRGQPGICVDDPGAWDARVAARAASRIRSRIRRKPQPTDATVETQDQQSSEGVGRDSDARLGADMAPTLEHGRLVRKCPAHVPEKSRPGAVPGKSCSSGRWLR